MEHWEEKFQESLDRCTGHDAISIMMLKMKLNFYTNIQSVLFFPIPQVFVYSMFVSQMAFHAKISDPAIGGTYMTLLNTVANLGE